MFFYKHNRILVPFGAPVVRPEPHLPVTLYFDAGGRADESRTWGVLCAIGSDADGQIGKILADLENRFPTFVDATGELKGRHLPDEAVLAAREGLRGWPIFFWGQHGYPDPTASDAREMAAIFDAFLAQLRPNSRASAATQAMVQASARRHLTYWRSLKPVNRHKLLCLMAHLQRLADEMRELDAANYRQVTVVVDQENFPAPYEAAWCIKYHVAAAVQSAGMSCRLTGSAPAEPPDVGAVVVDAAGESASTPGLQLVDILLQGTWRGLGDLKCRAC